MNRYHDEMLVVSAYFHAICTGQETTVLTFDEDIFEQFYKMSWLLETHYYSMLLAERFKVALYDTSKMIEDRAHEFFSHTPVVSFEKPHGELLGVCPTARHGVVLLHALQEAAQRRVSCLHHYACLWQPLA